MPVKAVVYTRFGPPDVLVLRDLPKPAPRDDEVLIRVHATTVTTAECHMRRGRPLWGRPLIGLVRPRRRYQVLGTELAGRVEAVGAKASRFRVGDDVFGFTGFDIGSNAEYKTLRHDASLEHMPRNLSYEQAAAAVDGPSTAWYFLKDLARVEAGQRVLVNGASGSIGTYAVQLAKLFGATVTGVCSTGNVEMVRSLGADRVVDYTTEDFARSGETYDVVFDTVGKSSFSRCRPILAPGGRYLATTGLTNVVLALWTSPGSSSRRRVRTGMSVEKKAALAALRDLIEAGKLTIVLDRSYPIEEIAAAHAYVEQGRKRGNVTIAV
jgi:NADPH2:quinone reductase